MKINERSLAIWAGSSSPIDKDGYLQKRGEVNKGFQKRWFVLKGNLLFYFDKRADKEPVGVIILEEHSVSLSQMREPKFCFEIGFRGANARTYTLSAESEEVMTSWMRALTHASFEYLRMMVVELQRQVAQLTEQKRDTAPLGLDRVEQPVAKRTQSTVSHARGRGPPARPPSPKQPEPLVQPLKTPGVSHAARLGTCGASSAQAIGYAAAGVGGNEDIFDLVATPPSERKAGHLSYSSPGLSRHHLQPGDDPTPLLQPEKTSTPGNSSSSSPRTARAASGTSATSSERGDSELEVSSSASSSGGVRKVDITEELESAEEQLQRLSLHSMHYNSSFLRDSPLTQRSSHVSPSPENLS